MPRSMWRGAISFGMVAIPVRMYLATESHSVSFRLLCPDHRVPIRNKRFCSTEEHEVTWNDVLRGYEVGKDEYVEVEDSDLENLPLATAHTIEILEFCPDEQIDAGIYVKAAYYLEPEQVGVKPYYLLKSALEKTGKVAIGKIALRDREHLCRLAMHDHGILLNTLHWPDEIRDSGDLSLPEQQTDVSKRELDMAVMLIENLSASFEPERHRDEYREALVKVVEAKLSDTPLPRQPTAEPAKVSDLMAALKASVEASKSSRAASEPASSNGAGEHPATAGRVTEVAARGRRAPASEPATRRRKAS